jgi:hypothetical protein
VPVQDPAPQPDPGGWDPSQAIRRRPRPTDRVGGADDRPHARGRTLRDIGKPYKWGGGHGRLFDSGYDCSSSVSYALIRAQLLGSPMVSGLLAHWGIKGAGKYVTIFANKSHVYMEVAGLRLDTSGVGDRGGKSGVRWRPPIGKRFGFAVRHISGL